MKNSQSVEIQIEDETYYEVKLLLPIVYRGRTLSPMAKNTLLGKMLKTLPEGAIASADPVKTSLS